MFFGKGFSIARPCRTHLAPEAAEVLHAQDGAARALAVAAAGVDGQVALEPLVGRVRRGVGARPADRGERGPLAGGGRARGAAPVRLELAHLAAEAVAGHAGQRLAAHVAEGGARVRAHVPAVDAVQQVLLPTTPNKQTNEQNENSVIIVAQ